MNKTFGFPGYLFQVGDRALLFNQEVEVVDWLGVPAWAVPVVALVNTSKDTNLLFAHCEMLERIPETFNTEQPQREASLAVGIDMKVDSVVWMFQECLDRDISPRKLFREVINAYSKERNNED